MAALLPTILSDDEDESSSIKGSGGRIANKSTKKQKKSPPDTDNVSDEEYDDGSTADEMDGDFEFGGLLVSGKYSQHLRHSTAKII